jgi:hypothetical protein
VFKELQSELKQLFDAIQFEHPTAVSLTMKKRVGSVACDTIIASNNFQQFRRRLESAVLGSAAKRHGRRLLMVAVLEISGDNRPHYHCIIDRPYYCSFERFNAIVCEQWQKVDFGYHHVDIQDRADTGWTDYILKQRQTSSLFDSIDWANCQLIAE